MSAKDRLGAHLRDELGINQESRALPLQAAWISAVSFATFAVVPVAALFLAPQRYSIPVIAAVSLASLSALGALGAHLGGAPIRRSLIRVTIGGASAMAATAVIGRLFGVATG